MIRKIPRFKTYRLVVSNRAAKTIPREEIEKSLEKHRTGDFGILSLDDWEENEKAIKFKNDFILSSFEYINNEETVEYYIKTRFDRKKTKIELSEELEERIESFLK